jgi:hypothetical protein
VLAPSLGEKVADDLIVKNASELRLDSKRLTLDEALQVFERMAQEPGLAGIAARFAKTRLILMWGAPKQ